MGEIFGYESKADFEKALAAEMEEMGSHGHREGARPGQPSPPAADRPRRPPDTKPLISGPQRSEKPRGKAGSRERIEQVRSYAPELFDQTVSQAMVEQRAQEIGLLLQYWDASERDDLNAAVVQELARGAWDLRDMDAALAIRGAVEQIGGEEASEYFDHLMESGLGHVQAQHRAEAEQAEQTRMESVHEGLTDEYATIERKLGPAGLEAADQIARLADEAGVLYEPEADPDAVRTGLRAAAEMGRAQEYAANVFLTSQKIGEEMKRIGAPGSRWTDADRAKWDLHMEAADLEVLDRAEQKYGHPDQAAANALHAKSIEKLGKDPLEIALDQEFEKMREHSSEAPHRQEMREIAADEFDHRYDSAGRDVSNRAEEFYERGR